MTTTQTTTSNTRYSAPTEESRPTLASVATSGISVRLLLASQIDAFRKRGFDVKAVCAPGPWVDKAREIGIDVDEVFMERELSPLKDVKSFISLWRYFREKKFQVVNTHTPKAGLLGPLAARLAGTPVVIHTVHGLLFHDETPFLTKIAGFGAELFTARCAQYLFFQVQEDVEVAAKMRLLPRDRLYYIGNGVDMSRFDPSRVKSRAQARRELGYTDTDFVVGIVARMNYEKGIGDFFAAARLLMQEHANVKFLVIGPREPDQNDKVKQEDVDAMERSGRFQFLGLRNDVPDLYPAMDTFILPSHREGIPRALIEACAMRTACIATNIRGCREVIENDVTGLMVPVRQPRAIADAVTRLITEPGLAARLATNAQEFVHKTYDQNVCNQRIVDALFDVMRKHGVEPPQG